MADAQQQQSQGQGQGQQRQRINLDQLSIDQLQRFRKQVEEEISQLKSNIATLTNALDRYNMSLNSVQRLSEGETELMIPLSSSMYVRGKTNTGGKVTIDLGTGLFAKVPNEEGQAILKRKIDYVARNRKAFQDDLKQKILLSENMTAVLQRRIQEQTAMLEATGVKQRAS